VTRQIETDMICDWLDKERRDWIKTIVSERYNRIKPIIITSNLTSERLAKTYAALIFDQVRQTSEVVQFTGESLRKGTSQVQRRLRRC